MQRPIKFNDKVKRYPIPEKVIPSYKKYKYNLELFRTNCKVYYKFVIIKGDMTHAYFGCNIVPLQKQLTDTN
jgi:hypothetical protein